ncbi:MAG: ABC transporter substrate-binding protein [Spirochaetaceae bacterium]
MTHDTRTGVIRCALFGVFVSAALSPVFPAGGAESGADAQVVEVAVAGEPDTLDPHATSGTLTFQVLRNVYDTLVVPNRDGRIEPGLATSWETGEDELTWTFTLRQGVEFHDGSELTSADVKATFERILADDSGSPWKAEFSSISRITTPDASTVVFELDRPHAPLLASLASGWGAILPAELIEAGHDFGNEPVGTGPFRVGDWVRDNRIELERHDAYWMEGVPRVDRVDFNIVTEPSVQVQGLISGDLHIIDTVLPGDVETIRETPGTELYRQLTALVLVMAMNTDREPLDQLAVRQAVNHAIDKEAVLDVAYTGGEVVGTFMDSQSPYYVEFSDMYPYDPDRARELLEEANIGDEVTLDLVVPQNYEFHVRAAEMYNAMLAEVGLDTDLRLVDWSTWISDVYRNRRYDLTVVGHTGKLDPHGRLTEEFGYTNWENARAEELIEQARRESDFDTRRRLYGEVLEIMAREVPFMYLGSPYLYVGLREEVEGFEMDPALDTYDFRHLRLE